MNILYLFTTYFSTLISLIIAILLFVRRKHSERSRVILALANFLGATSYAYLFIRGFQMGTSEPVVSERTLLIALFMTTVYTMYPIEVICPEYFNLKRIFRHFSICFTSIGIYLFAVSINIHFTRYESLTMMFTDITQFDVWFRILLLLLIFSSIIYIFYVRINSKHHQNIDRKWIKKFTFLFSINYIAYISLFIIPNPNLKILYCNVSIVCSLLIVYLELFVRITRTQINHSEIIGNKTSALEVNIGYTKNSMAESRNEIIAERVHCYMNKHKAYCDPDLSITTLASKLRTNRTTLSIVVQEMGYENFTTYINSLRINEFIKRINSDKEINFQDAFYDVGFRSRTTATRNFRLVTGTTPSIYFQQNKHD